ncbi:hypothetical protein C8J56DRAFT_1024173 [Mycena floridula]|nr:hypothetical protein C8J56DRAFT_1024173 [Mycena floridula]
MSSALFKAAKAGNVEAIKQLGARCLSNEFTFPQLLPILLTHITKPLPLSSVDSEVFLTNFVGSDPVLPSLEALASGLTVKRDEHQTYKTLREHWPSLSDWLGFGIKNLLQPTSMICSLPDKRRICHSLAGVIIWISSALKIFEPILPGLVKLDIQVYICAVALGERRSRVAWKGIGLLNLLDGTVSKVTAMEYDRVELIEALQETPTSVSLIISDLKAISPRYVEGMINHFAPLTIIGRLSSGVYDKRYHDPRIRSFHMIFVAHNAISVVISLMNRINESCTEPAEMDWTFEVIHLFSLYLQMSIEQGGPAIIAQAIDNDLLNAMARLLPLLSRASEGRNRDTGIPSYKMILLALRTLMPHPLVFRAARRWTKSPRWSAIPEDHNPVHEQWQTFQEAIATTLSVRRDYKLMSRSICGNPLCPTLETPVNQARACGGCLSVHYCSKECQRRDWVARHKETCRPPPAQFSIAQGPFIMKDFLTWLFLQQSNTLNIKEDVLARARGKYPVVAKCAYLLRDDCGFTVMSGEDFLRKEAKWESDELVKALVRQRKTGVIFYFLLADTTPIPFYSYNVIEA